jgi:coenzyme F420-0:L-glutamate ligase/coenzyme F420-1:gamma-L-glutamate ligase
MLMLGESKKVLRTKMIDGIGKIIVEMKSGVICADAGIDSSNTPTNFVTLLPVDPDKSAAKIRAEILQKTGKDVAVIISDSHGRAFRNAAVNITLGVAGIKEIKDYRGKIDLFGYRLQKKQIAIADELASAAELVMGEADEGMPIVLIRGYQYNDKEGNSQRLIRPRDQDLFY